jgi:hypothetical protein
VSRRHVSPMFINAVRYGFCHQKRTVYCQIFNQRNLFNVFRAELCVAPQASRPTSSFLYFTSMPFRRSLVTKAKIKKNALSHHDEISESESHSPTETQTQATISQPQFESDSQTQSRSESQHPVSPSQEASSMHSLRKDEELSASKYRLTPIEKMRSLVESRKSGTLTTTNLFPPPGHMPMYGSLMPYVLLQRWPGCPVIALRTDEKHYEHIQKSTRCSMLIYALTPREINPGQVPVPRVNMLADIRPVESEEAIEMVFEKYKVVHPGSERFLQDRQLFKYYILEPDVLYFFFGSDGKEIPHATGDEYTKAFVDPIAPYSKELIEMMNQKYRTELKLLCKEYGDHDVDEAFMTCVDRLGFDIMAKVSDNWIDFRVPWDMPITKVEDYRYELESCVQRLRARNKKEK